MILTPVHSRQATYLIDLLRELVGRELKLRYKRSVLGMVWSLLVPLAQLMVFVFLSRSVLKLDIPNYPLFVLVGLLGWNWFQSSLLLGTTVISDNRSLIRRPGFPAAILPAVTVVTSLIHYLLALPVMLVFAFISGVQPAPALLAFPVIIAVQFLFTLGLTYLLASLHVTFRDLQHLLGIILTLLFYLTPVFYSTQNVPPQYHAQYQANPVAHLLEAARRVLLDGQWPDWGALLLLGIGGAALLSGSLVLFIRSSERFAEEL